MALTIKVDSVTRSGGVYHGYVLVLDGESIIAKAQVDFDPAKETATQLKERVRALLKPEVQSHLDRSQKMADMQAALSALDPNNL